MRRIPVILPLVSCGLETRSFTLREELRPVFENRMLRRIFGPKRDEVTEEWKKNYIMRSFMICTAHPIFFG
jgi:hypothetical protein